MQNTSSLSMYYLRSFHTYKIKVKKCKIQSSLSDLNCEFVLIQTLNSIALRQGRFQPDAKEVFLAIRVVKHWNQQPSAVISTPITNYLGRLLPLRLGEWAGWCLEVPSVLR